MDSLCAKGYQEESGARDHHVFVYYHNGRKTRIRTKTSRSPKIRTLDSSLVSKMAHQCHLTKDDFVRLVRCPLSAEEYRLILADKQLLG
ncbi:MAG: hypothetical protein KJ747_00920 [Actinobacteria bacterium]|nr:hypothetical protein [Actinomycetota bacterium]